MGFFDEYNRFEETGYASSAERLNRRYDAIIENNKNIIKGSTILDIGAHDGRFAFAALKAGAKKVIGIEPRPELINVANENMEFYEVDKKKYKYVLDDVPGALYKIKEKIDVVLMLGFLYHTMKHYEVFEALQKIGPEHIIIDSNVMQLADKPNAAAVVFGKELSADPLNSIGDQEKALVGIPTRAAIIILLDYFGYDYEEYNWGAIPPHASIMQYVQKGRVTILGKKRRVAAALKEPRANVAG